MDIKRVSPAEALELIEKDGWVYLDVRSVPEFDQGHPSGAYNVPLLHMGPGGSAPNPDFLAVMEQRFPKEAQLVVGCRTSKRSEHAVALLERAGYSNLAVQTGGFVGAQDPFGRSAPGWGPMGLPASQEPEPGRSWGELSAKEGE